MSSIILKDLLKHKIRKQIIKSNKKLNHKAFTKAMNWGQKIPFLMKYHKKKLVFFLVLGIITWNYSLHKTAYHWLLGMRPPHKILLGMIIDLPPVQQTVLDLNTRKAQLSQDTKDILIKLHYESDKFLYFGLGRKFLYELYLQLGLLQTQDQQKMFYQKSQFYKKRNQLAAGVGLVQHLLLFEQALKKKQQKHPEVTEQSFRDDFVRKFIELAPEIMRWEREFNESRQKQYIKNAPGMTQVKKQVVSQILKENVEISLEEIEDRLTKLGLRGLNLSDRFYFYSSKEVWKSMQELNIRKKLSHPTIHLNLDEKNRLERELEQILKVKQDLSRIKQADLKEFQKMYEKQLL